MRTKHIYKIVRHSFMCLLLLIFFKPGLLYAQILTQNLSITLFQIVGKENYSVIPFYKIGNLIVLKGKVDSVEGNFVLDTGAPDLVLNSKYFHDYTATFVDGDQTSITGSSGSISKITIGKFNLGMLNYFNKEVDIVNLTSIEKLRGIKIIGLLGVQLFMDCEFIIDFDQSLLYIHRISSFHNGIKNLELHSDTSRFVSIPFYLNKNRIVTESLFFGRKFNWVIDCAAESNLLNCHLPNKILEKVIVTNRIKLMGVGNNQIVAICGYLNKLEWNQFNFEHMNVIITNLEHTSFFSNNRLAGVLNTEVFSKHKLGFNFVEHQMYIWN